VPAVRTPAQLFDLTGRTAIITGSSRGIGLGLAHGFAAAGARVVISSRKAEACEKAAAEVIAEGGDAIAVPAHAGNLDDIARLVSSTLDAFGGIDIVVNNAATSLAQPLGEMTPEAWQKVQDANLRGPLFLIQEALPSLRASAHASVINVVTAGVFLASANVAMYAAAKTALLSLTRSMASQYAKDGIRVNALAPGAVDTDMTRGTGEAGMEGMRNASAQKRIATVEEMVGPALLLASDAGSFITGEVLVADGGLCYH
jgi:NAD(P)-dependent dehydrogenase (short-subunit alcohol dehydrogenase family)